MIGIIVPAYKTEEYIVECVESVLGQTYTDFCMVLVEDGSPDHCGEICDRYAEKDKRIVVIHQKNRGLSGARNAGLDWLFANTSVDYVAFVDSDDVIHLQMIELLYNSLREMDADISGSDLDKTSDEQLKRQYTTEEYLKTVQCWTTAECYQNQEKFGTGVTRKLYKASFFQDFRFPEGRLHEDEFTTYKLIYNARKIVWSNCVLYFYRQREGSIMHTAPSAKSIGDKLDALYEKISFFKENDEQEYAEKAKRTALVSNAKSVILAIQDKRYTREHFPDRYRMSKLKALYFIHKYCPDENYSYFLYKVSPYGLKIHQYIRKLRSMLKLRKK